MAKSAIASLKKVRPRSPLGLAPLGVAAVLPGSVAMRPDMGMLKGEKHLLRKEDPEDPWACSPADVWMYDSFGDGWQGAEITFQSCDGAVLSSHTIKHGDSGHDTTCLPAEYRVSVSRDDWPGEVSWKVDPMDLSGGAPFTGGTCSGDPECSNSEIWMYDSFGDGWQGAELNILTCDGRIISSHTLKQGTTGHETACLPAEWRVEVGHDEYPEEVSWTVAGHGGGAEFEGGTCPGEVWPDPAVITDHGPIVASNETDWWHDTVPDWNPPEYNPEEEHHPSNNPADASDWWNIDWNMDSE